MNRSMLALSVLAATVLFAGDFKVGSKVADFHLQDLNGKEVNFSSVKGDNVTALLFIATECPVSNAYNERMNALYNDYAARGVTFIGINPNRTEPATEVAQHAKSNGFEFAVYKDDGNIVADRFGATVTPEVVILNKDGVVVYHGHIDDSQNPARIKKQGMRAALDSALAGQQVAEAETKAFGCTIKKVERPS